MPIKITIIGKVHDVGYRLFLLEEADYLFIPYFDARNVKINGKEALIVLVDGDEEQLKEFVEFVKTNKPEKAVVEEIRIEEYRGRVRDIERFRASFNTAQLSKIVQIGLRMLEKQDSMLEKQDTMLGKMDLMLQKQDTMLDKMDLMLQKQDLMLEKQDSMLQKQDTMLSKMDSMLQKQDSMLQKQDTMLSKMDLMLQKQDETIKVIREESEKTREELKSVIREESEKTRKEIKEVSSKLDKTNELLERRFEKLEEEIERIKKALIKAGIDI